MHPVIPGQLRVECAAQHIPLPDKHDFAVMPRQYLDAWPGFHDIGRPDKDRAQRLRSQRGNVQRRFK